MRKLTIFVLLTSLGSLLLLADPAAGTIVIGGNSQPLYTGEDPWNVGGNLTVGITELGQMVLSGNSKVVDVNAYLGYLAGSEGRVLITEPNCLWQNSKGLFIGGSATQAGGTGVLLIMAGRVDANQLTIIWNEGGLAGDGTLKSPSVTNWGIISPGQDGIGTLTIDGDLTFKPGGILEVDVNDSGASDKLVVTGDVNAVGGKVNVYPAQTLTGTKDYTIMDANSIKGALGVTDTALLDLTLADPNGGPHMLLRITAARFDADFAQTPNQRGMAAVLQAIADAGGSPITSTLQQLPTLDAVRAAYDELSGQSRPALAPVLVTDTAKFMGIVSNRLQGARGSVARDLRNLSDAPLLAAAEPMGGIGSPTERGWDSFLWDMGPDTSNQGWGTWAKLYGLSGDRKTEGNATGYSYSIFGQTIGIEGQSGERSIWGITLGRSDGQVDYDTVSDEADLTTTHFGVYNTYSGAGWYLNSLLMYSKMSVETERAVDVIGERLEGELEGRELGAYFEAGLDWQPAPTWLVQPLAALQVALLQLDEYVETGGVGALSFEDQQYDSYRVSLGGKLTKELMLGPQGLTAIVQARGRWVHELGDVVSEVEARLQDAPPVPFDVSDEAIDRNSILLGAGVGIRITRGLRVFVDYDTGFNSDKTVHVISGALDYRW